MIPRRTRLLRRAVLAAAVLALAVFVYLRYVPKYPQAAYETQSYSALCAALDGESRIYLPPESLLPEGTNTFLVRLVSRASSAPSGYSISRTTPGGRQDFVLECEALALLAEAGEERPPLEPIRGDTAYRAVPIQLFERGELTAAAFDYGEQRYSVSMLEADALAFAKALLDTILPP